ncbi:hypothetical protein P886_3796 [Alteromonadaceae bacterium 2753L.S.0a.02]|nr:hypothetical protein P886_3796 [Alteromonadaceae bacterium 2753L.S.0a.02]
MLMALGFFIFDLRSAPYEQLQRISQWRHAEQQRTGARPVYQYTGPGADTITLTGTLYPEITSGRVTLDLLRTMATDGKGWPLIEGTGRLYGFWAITEVRETSTHFMRDGIPQKIEFSVSLVRVDESDPSLLGTATNAALEAATGVLSKPLNRLRF